MAKTGNEFGLERESTAKAFLGLDLNSSKTKDPAGGKIIQSSNALVTNPVVNEFNQQSQCILMTLPLELRLRIYGHLLISWFDRNQNRSWAVGKTDQKMIIIDMPPLEQYRTDMAPSILQTCKRISDEASPILYSNVFNTSKASPLIQLFAQIGLQNLRLIKNLDVFVPYSADLKDWLQLLQILADKATGLRSLALCWGSDFLDDKLPWKHKRGAIQRGLGDNLEFVRALGRIKGLNECIIEGHYVEHWPDYLEREMGVKVKAIRGYYFEVKDLDEEWIRERTERELREFAQYQEGTDDLMP